MHIEAVRMTSNTFSKFIQEHDIERVEELKETLSTMIEDACEINDTLTESTGPYQVDTEDIEDEYKQMQLQIQLPVVPNINARTMDTNRIDRGRGQTTSHAAGSIITKNDANAFDQHFVVASSPPKIGGAS